MSDWSRVANPPTSTSPWSAWRLRISRIFPCPTGQGWSQRSGTSYQSRTKRFVFYFWPSSLIPRLSLMSHTHHLEIPRSGCPRRWTFQTGKQGCVRRWTVDYRKDSEGEGGGGCIRTLLYRAIACSSSSKDTGSTPLSLVAVKAPQTIQPCVYILFPYLYGYYALPACARGGNHDCISQRAELSAFLSLLWFFPCKTLIFLLLLFTIPIAFRSAEYIWLSTNAYVPLPAFWETIPQGKFAIVLCERIRFKRGY